MGPARVRTKSDGMMTVQRFGWGNNGWRPRATLIIEDATAGGSELRVRLDRTAGVKVFWIGWQLVLIWIVAPSIGRALTDPLNFMSGLAVVVMFGQAPALLTALAWDREPAKLLDLIVLQLRASDGGILGRS